MAEHSIWGTADYPVALTLATDAAPSITLGNPFYRTDSSTDSWMIAGGRLYVPASVAASVPSTVTISLFFGDYDTTFSEPVVPDFSVTPAQSKTVTVAAGWNEARFDTPQTIPVPSNSGSIAWIAYSFGNEAYLASEDGAITPRPVQALDGSDIFLSEGSHVSAFRIGTGDTQVSSEQYFYGVDIIFDDGTGGTETPPVETGVYVRQAGSFVPGTIYRRSGGVWEAANPVA